MATTVAMATVATTILIDSLCEVTKAGLHERPWLLDIDAAPYFRFWHIATAGHVATTVAIGGKADIGSTRRNVRF